MGGGIGIPFEISALPRYRQDESFAVVFGWPISVRLAYQDVCRPPPALPRKRRLEDEFRGAIRVRGYSSPPRSQVALGNGLFAKFHLDEAQIRGNVYSQVQLGSEGGRLRCFRSTPKWKQVDLTCGRFFLSNADGKSAALLSRRPASGRGKDRKGVFWTKNSLRW